MPEAVIVDAVRTPIGRAFKGSLPQVRPDDLTAYVIDQLLERNPDVDPASVADVICGCGMTQGEQAYNIGRIAVLLSEKLPDSVTGATVARYCASSLNAIQIAADSIRAGTAENVAEKFGVKREDMDVYAKRSQDLAVEARDGGFFDREIVPVETPDHG